MATEPEQHDPMGRRRALLTDRERELIANPDTEEENYRYQSISRVRNKIEDELPEDVEILEEYHPGLLEEFRAVVCADTIDDVDAEDLRARLQNALEVRDDQRARADRLEVELEDCRALLEQAQADGFALPVGRIEQGVSAALTALEGQSPDVDMARSELEGVQEVLQDDE